MIKRTLYFENPCYLKTRDKQLVVDFPEEEKKTRSVPLEDVGMIVLENQQITLTQGLMAALMNNNSAILSCNEKHLP